jgi:hypothetical protein
MFAQVELLGVDHPATRTLIRCYEYGSIPEFPREHLPISRRLAYDLLARANRDSLLPSALRRQAAYYRDELGADIGAVPTAVFIPTRDDSHLIYSDPFEGLPISLVEYRDTLRRIRLDFEGIADGELRTDPGDGLRTMIFQGGFQLRGTILDRFGFSSRITNGTIVGDTTLPLRDPRFSHSFKFGVLHNGRDIDFASAHVRADFDAVAVEIGREKIQLGGGLDESLLIGSDLPSNFDYLRLTAHLGRVSFSHLHASVLADPTGRALSGVTAQVPQKYLAAHLISAGPFGGIRASIGESVIYSGRSFEIGYINPFNFLKSEEHYLRDRDNTNMYAALSVNPIAGIFAEGEFMLDDLQFSRIGEGFWGNKTAWRVGAKSVAFPWSLADIGLSYTRFEPYVFSHFDPENAYTHDGTLIAGAGMEPNSELLEGSLRFVPLPGLWIRAVIGLGKHGANVTNDSGRVIRNVGGDARLTHDAADTSAVSFLDGNLQTTTRMVLEAEYEPIRNVYFHLMARSDGVETGSANDRHTEIRIGLRVGAY